MTSAVIFYTILFFVLIAFPAGLVIAALLFFEHERLIWERMAPWIGPMDRTLARNPRGDCHEVALPARSRIFDSSP